MIDMFALRGMTVRFYRHTDSRGAVCAATKDGHHVAFGYGRTYGIALHEAFKHHFYGIEL